MKTQLPDAPSLEVELVHGELLENNRWDAGYYDHAFRENEKRLSKLGAVLLPALRLTLAQGCELRLVITLPRVFKNNNARMAIVYLVRTATPDANRRVLLAEVREKWRDTDGVERTTDLYGELERIIDCHLET